MHIDSFEPLILNENNFSLYTEEAILQDNGLILKKGSYKIQLYIDVDESNEGDILSIYLDNKIYRDIDIPIGLGEKLQINLTLDINKNTLVSFINKSDDFLILKHVNGGVYMSEPLQIINFTKFNPFSFDLEINVPFTDDIDVKVQKVGTTMTDLTLIPTRIVDKLNLKDPANSTEGNPKLKTVIVSSSVLFDVDAQYKVEVYNNDSLTSGLYSFDFNTFPMMNENNCTVKSFGTRVLVIEFDYPVMNLADQVEITGNTGVNQVIELNNFYISYQDKDIITDTADNTWLGDIRVQEPYVNNGTTLAIFPFSATLSPDNRRVEIQSNLYNLNTAAVNRLAVNYSLTPKRDLTKTLRDYSGRIIATFSKDFTCTRETVAADITSTGVKALSNHELQVTFDKPVCTKRPVSVPPGAQYIDYFKFWGYFGVDKVLDSNNSVALPIASVNRVGNGFNTIIYNIQEGDIDDLLPIPTATVRVGKVLDASGLDTDPQVKTIPVPPTQPKLINVYQEVPGNNTQTKIRIVYSEIMNATTGSNSATNTLNYLLQDPNGSTILLITNSIIPVSGTNNKEFTLTIPSVLPTGEYKLTAYNPIQDYTGMNIETTTKTFKITDFIAPLVQKIIAQTPDPDTDTIMGPTDNGMVIMFDRPMNVSNTDQHSVLNQQNYVMEYGTVQGQPANTLYYLSDNTIIDKIYDNRWIRYTLNESNMPEYDKSKYFIHIGYVQGQYVYYVTSQSGNIYPLCSIEAIDELVDPLNIVNGKAEVTNDSTIIYNLDSGTNNATGSYKNNLFSSVDIDDFEVSIDGGTTYNKTPISVIFSGYPFNQVIFNFVPSTFSSSQSIMIRVKNSAPKSRDIFNKPIVYGNTTALTVSNNIPTAIKGIGLLDVASNNKATLELLFEKSILQYEASDFEVNYGITPSAVPLQVAKGAIIPTIDSASVRPNTITLIADLPNKSDNVLQNIYTSLVNSSILNIRDINNKPIKLFFDQKSDMLKAVEFRWKYNVAGGGANESYELSLKFNKNISSKYITTPQNTITPTIDASNRVVTLTVAKVGQFKLNFSSDKVLGTAKTWGAAITVSGDTMTIKLTGTSNAYLFDASATGGVGRANSTFNPYPTSIGAATDCAIVDENDTIRVLSYVPAGTIV